ncbi:hypothetical protein [Paenibacillus cymbidii]|uniref:hypothetical protein n=1 Tax=Paenibacillus cymbidii TaxID=1639034 RepID=UPI0010808E53|nr:hypothetical protein [Paenibacillus cymbidii]
MTTPQQYAVREVALATFYDIQTGKARVQLQNLKTSGLENSAETVYARGGRGNAKIVGFSSNREGKVKLQDALITNEALAMLTSNNVAIASANIYQRDELVVSSDAAALKFTPAAAGSLISVYKLNPDGTHGSELAYTASAAASGKYTVTGKTLGFFADEIADGAKVVAYYKTETDEDASTITVSSDKFAGSFKVVLDCLVRDAYTKQDYAAQIVINNAKLLDSFKFSMASTGDPTMLDLELDILKPINGNDMWTMTVYDETLLA